MKWVGNLLKNIVMILKKYVLIKMVLENVALKLLTNYEN